ncbi:rhamnogalacturonidase [Sphingomonas sp.]|uniref:rhamnogalacturonidase n=1 Tax=Sphingomonas sp. TaxID=28214 RepID=UPI002ED7C039
MIDVREMGAKGDGKALDHAAINRAIAEAARGGGGTVLLPAGRYLCFSIRLMSNVTLMIGPSATVVAADPKSDGGAYDLPEATEHDVYQDFGHSHWRNSLIWGEGLENVAILGPGMIHGVGLTRHGPGPKWLKAGSHPNSMAGMTNRDMSTLEPARTRMNGLANKAIALKNCRNVTLDGFSILKGGHFAVLATGVDNLTVENLRIDTDRDGLDIDACRHVRITGCAVNSPNDDAIVLKASLALGFARATENVTISDCIVSGYDMGTMLDGTYARTQELSPDRDRVTGRIKLGTESNGGFRNIAITNCVFDRSRGLALETVDGGVLEDVTISNLTMRDITTAPLFLRIGDRRRGPEGTGLGAMRRVTISNVTATGIDPRYAASIVGLSDAPVEDVSISNVRLAYTGGGTAQEAARDVPEARDSYPEPSMFGVLPAHGLYVRHARGLRIDGLEISTATPDARPAIILDDVENVRFTRLGAQDAPILRGSRNVIVE